MYLVFEKVDISNLMILSSLNLTFESNIIFINNFDIIYPFFNKLQSNFSVSIILFNLYLWYYCNYNQVLNTEFLGATSFAQNDLLFAHVLFRPMMMN